MTDQPPMPGGYTTGAQAVQDLVNLSQLLTAALDCKARLTHALGEINRMIIRTDGARKDALCAVERFADENPTSLGVCVSPQIQAGIAVIGERLGRMEADVRDVLQRAGEL